MRVYVVRALALCLGLSALPACAQFSIAPLSTFGSGGWLAPNGYNGSTYTYLTTGDTERGLACGNNHLYLVSRNGGDFVRVLDAQTGAELGTLNLGSGIVSGGIFDVNMVAVGADGAIYVGNLATGPAPFTIYRWANDLSTTTPVVVYNNVPLAGARVGDSLAAIGSGSATRLVAGFNSIPSVAGNSGYAIIDPTAGTATAVAFAGTPPAAGDFRLGIGFADFGHVVGTQGGAGSALRYSTFSGGTGTLLASPALASTDERALGFAVVEGIPLMAALSTRDNHVSIYDLTDPTQPVLLGQANATSGTLPADTHNTGAVAWGNITGNTAALYAMATDDGIQAFVVTLPVPTPPTITLQPQSQAVLELSPVTFSVAAGGTPAPAYQWYEDASAIPGATNAAFTIPAAPYSDNGAQFKVVVQNVVSNVAYAVTSSVATLTVTPDTNAPTLLGMIPTPGTTVPSLGEIEVHFSKSVQGVAAEDLLIDGLPATNLTAYAPDVYVFDFPQPPPGTVQVAWSPAQAITDLCALANRFAGGSCTYTLDPSAITRSVWLNEFMAANNHSIVDDTGQHSDWLELYNASQQAVELGGWYLTDDPASLTKWRFPAGVRLLAQSYMIIWASGLDHTDPAAPLHTNFKLSKAAGSYLELVYADGLTILSAFAPYPQQYDDVSYGRDRLDRSLVGYFTNATPGAANASLGPGFAPQVQFSVVSRTFQQPFALALSATDSNAVIRYLLVNNGAAAAITNVPGANSLLYTQPLTISSSVQVRARAFPPQANSLPGPLHSETYLQIASNAASFTSDLPLVVFHDMGGGPVAATADQFMTMQVFDTRSRGRSSLLNPPDLATQGFFHRRGQATFWNPKANLRVQTEDEYGDNLNVELLGMPADNDWVFYAINKYDKILMHNPLVHELYRELGHYTSRTRFVEVFLKVGSGAPGPITTADYNGLYVLEEKIKIGENRVDIAKLQPSDSNSPNVTGGYLLSIDKSNPGNPAYLAGVSMWYLDPDYYEITSPARAAQLQYIDNYFSAFYAALTGPNWTNPATGYAAYIDLASWLDYHLHQTLVFNVDALRISAFFHKPRNGPIVQGPLWDFDRCFGTRTSDDARGFNPRRWRSAGMDGGTDMFNPASTFNNPWYGALFRDPDFWQRWIDRYQALRQTVYHLTNIMAKIDYFADQAREAAPRDAARWAAAANGGDDSADTSPRSGTVSGDGLTYTFPTPGTYQGEVNFAKYWFSNRLDFMDSNFLNPPVFSANGGAITAGYSLTITAATRESGSTIYFTLDGADPRLPGGAVSPSALASLNTTTITLTNNARVCARNYNAAHHNLTGPNNPPLSSSWSGPTAGTFIVAAAALAITEIMYDPAPPAAGTNDNDQYEFIELKNVGAQPLSLLGISFTDGIYFTFTATNAITNLGPGQYLVLVRNQTAFQSRYPEVTNIAGQYAGALNNAGERLYLQGALQEPILDFAYDGNWYPVTQGQGFSLVIRNENAPSCTWTNPASWRPSTALGGSPGRADPAPAAFPPVVVNEALTHTDLPELDSIELFNPASTPAAIGGWFLTDDHTRPAKYCLPADTVIPPGGCVVFTEDQFSNNGANSFRLSSLGSEVYLFSGDGTNITGYRHGFQFGAQANGVTTGRCVTSDGLEHFVAQKRNTLGAANAGPKVGPVVLNELMYAPPPFGLDADTADEYLELRNITSQTVPLFDPLYPTNTWQLHGAVTYAFPPGVTVPPLSYLLVVSFDPDRDPASLNWFRRLYGLDTNTPIFGPYQGHLANEGETLGLYFPDHPQPPSAPNPGFVPYVLAEEMHYSALPPWPAGADGTGSSLQRIASVAFGDDPANWQAGLPTPGSVNQGAWTADTDHDGLPDEWELANGLDPTDPTGLNGPLGDPDGDGLTNYQEFIAGTDPHDSQDFLAFRRVSLSSQSCLLTFNTRPGRTYAVQALNALGPTNTWTTFTNAIPGTGNPVTVCEPLTQTARFYRLNVSLSQ